jgi:hypothetical protein
MPIKLRCPTLALATTLTMAVSVNAQAAPAHQMDRYKPIVRSTPLSTGQTQASLPILPTPTTKST